MSPIRANQGIHVALCAPPIMLENVLVWAPFTPQSGINKSVAWAEPLEGAQTTQSAIATVRSQVVGYEKRSPTPSDSAIGGRKIRASKIAIEPVPGIPEQTG